MPIAFFLAPVRTTEPERTVFWRSTAAATAMARTRAQRRFGWLKHLIDYLASHVHFPVVNFPDWEFPTDPMDITERDIEDAAIRVRAYWGLGDGPISNVVYLLENNGAALGRMRLVAETLDAFSQWRGTDQRPYVVLGADKGSAARSRWDAAHELGHMIAHRDIAPAVFARRAAFQLMESQAHDFAGAFLLPASSFADDFVVPTLDALQALKLKWNVSMAAMLQRARKLDLITDEQQRRFFQSYARKGYKHGEPLDDRVVPEQPQLARQAITLLLDGGVLTRAQLRTALPYSTADLEDISGLPSGFLSDEPQVHVLPARPAQRQPPSGSSGGGTVIQFPGAKHG